MTWARLHKVTFRGATTACPPLLRAKTQRIWPHERSGLWQAPANMTQRVSQHDACRQAGKRRDACPGAPQSVRHLSNRRGDLGHKKLPCRALSTSLFRPASWVHPYDRDPHPRGRARTGSCRRSCIPVACVCVVGREMRLGDVSRSGPRRRPVATRVRDRARRASGSTRALTLGVLKKRQGTCFRDFCCRPGSIHSR